ncbi:ribonuclease HII [Sporosarcina jiandibaonis]|uniref:ribonuclease HII n=1 Tax=Sporosarcina jiandibaonis TaxID=2715535 RepID=UPI0015570290|nr:ribonuclease HII [Sporosarcina jiandibaonis]
MLTIKEIEEKLKSIQEPSLWIEELKNDQRSGVHKALARWQRNYEMRELQLREHQEKIAFDRSYAPFAEALVAGVDEAGRGPLAGPVVTAAVILPMKSTELVGLDDSKTISKEKREQLAETIRQIAIAYSIHIQSADKIDELNIYAATRSSMEKAVSGLAPQPDFVIADAMSLDTKCQTASVVKADAKSLAVAAASILAKTTRDSIMDTIHNDFPMYNFTKNAGYGTAEHLAALRENGPCKHHRKTFEPVKTIIANQTSILI